MASTSYNWPVNSSTVTATNPSVGINGIPAPASSSELGFVDGSGNLQPLTGTVANGPIVNVSASVLPTGAATAANQTTANTSLATIATNTPSVGQKAMAASSPVTIASDQSALAVSAASLPLPAGAATETTLAAQSAKLPATLGQKAMAASMSIAIASDQSAVPVSAAALPLPAGASTSANQTTGNTSLATIATNSAKSLINPAGNSPGSGTVSTVATLTAPANAIGFILMNLDTSTVNIRWRLGAVATTSSGQQLQPGRDSGYVPCGANISICAESGTQNYDVQWVLNQ